MTALLERMNIDTASRLLERAERDGVDVKEMDYGEKQRIIREAIMEEDQSQ